MKIKTSELSGAALDWAVAKCMPFAEDVYVKAACVIWKDSVYQPHLDWAQGGPIIERERIAVEYSAQAGDWFADSAPSATVSRIEYGPAPLIAAMRCYVAYKLGDEVDVPEELCK